MSELSLGAAMFLIGALCAVWSKPLLRMALRSQKAVHSAVGLEYAISQKMVRFSAVGFRVGAVAISIAGMAISCGIFRVGR